MRAGVLLMLVLAACDGTERASPAPEPVEVPEPEIAEPDRTPEKRAPVETRTPVERPATGCAFGDPVRIAGDGWASIAALESGFAIFGSSTEGEAETLYVEHLAPDGTTRRIASGPLEHGVPATHRRASPAIAARGDRVSIAIVDGERRLLFAQLDASASNARLSLRPIAEGASVRFAPALEGPGTFAAFTDESATPMRVRAVRIAARSEAIEIAENTGAAPVFVRGANGVLAFVDPFDALSVVKRVDLGAAPYAAQIARPLNLVADPPELAVVRIGENDYFAYTGVGSLATAAVGLVPIATSVQPVAIVRGTGYGTLHVDVASLGDRAIFVADAPQASPPTSPRELHLRSLDASGSLGETSVVRGPSGSAARGRIAVSNGAIAVTFSDGTAVYAVIGRCAE
jgi:hypothetical protein